ncbi:MAG TPA: FkbM family methyltransferase [Tepidisphaeraceae bacterium]|jgi:FkbM family methyltransferase
MSLTRVHGHTFFDECIHADSTVIDAGANHGGFSAAMRQRFGCEPWAIEANPTLARSLEVQTDRIFHVALAGQSGRLRFQVNEADECSRFLADNESSDRAVEVEAISLQELLNRAAIVGQVDLLKIDIEGAETQTLLSADVDLLRRFRQITVEIHDFNDLVSPAQVEQLSHHLAAAGFDIIRATHRFHDDTLFFRRDAVGVSKLKVLWAKHVMRNVFGIGRILRRRISAFSGSKAGH